LPLYRDLDDYIFTLLRHLHSAWSIAEKEIREAQAIQKAWYDAKYHAISFDYASGDRILIRVEKPATKLDQLFFNPFEVVCTRAGTFTVLRFTVFTVLRYFWTDFFTFTFTVFRP